MGFVSLVDIEIDRVKTGLDHLSVVGIDIVRVKTGLDHLL